jgi:hypothetical protein
MTALVIKYWKPLAAVLVVAILVLLLWQNRSLRYENETLTAANETYKTLVGRMSADLEANRRALEQRQAETASLAGERDRLLSDLEKIYATDDEACSWSNGSIPSAVYDKLCQ